MKSFTFSCLLMVICFLNVSELSLAQKKLLRPFSIKVKIGWTFPLVEFRQYFSRSCMILVEILNKERIHELRHQYQQS